MSDASARFALPFILPGQAQKEVYHNEALARIDMALHPAVEGDALAVPPLAPGVGKCIIFPFSYMHSIWNDAELITVSKVSVQARRLRLCCQKAPFHDLDEMMCRGRRALKRDKTLWVAWSGENISTN